MDNKKTQYIWKLITNANITKRNKAKAIDLDYHDFLIISTIFGYFIFLYSYSFNINKIKFQLNPIKSFGFNFICFLYNQNFEKCSLLSC